MLDAFRSRRRRARGSALVAAMTLTIAVTGCATDDSKTPDTAPSQTSKSSEPSASTGLTYATDPPAAIDAGRAAAAEDGRPVLLDFGADWCVDCNVLDELYGRPAVSRVLDQGFHLVKIDVGEFDKNLDVAAEYIDLDTSDIPALVVIKPDGKVAYASNDGEFASARTMDEQQLLAFLGRWTGPA